MLAHLHVEPGDLRARKQGHMTAARPDRRLRFLGVFEFTSVLEF